MIPRVSSLTDLSLNAAGALLGAVLGSGFHALGQSMAPQVDRSSPIARNVAFAILVLWLIERLWPLIPDPGLRQLKYAVRPLLTPRMEWLELAGFFVGWLVVAQARVPHDQATTLRRYLADRHSDGAGRAHVHRRQRLGHRRNRGDRAAAAGTGAAEPARRSDSARAVVALLLGTWLAWTAARPLLNGSAVLGARSLPAFKEMLLRSGHRRRNWPQGFSYMSLAWLLAGAGFRSACRRRHHVLFVVLLVHAAVGRGGAVLRLGGPADRCRGRLDRRALDAEGAATLGSQDRTGSTDQRAQSGGRRCRRASAGAPGAPVR